MRSLADYECCTRIDLIGYINIGPNEGPMRRIQASKEAYNSKLISCHSISAESIKEYTTFHRIINLVTITLTGPQRPDRLFFCSSLKIAPSMFLVFSLAFQLNDFNRIARIESRLGDADRMESGDCSLIRMILIGPKSHVKKLRFDFAG